MKSQNSAVLLPLFLGTQKISTTAFNSLITLSQLLTYPISFFLITLLGVRVRRPQGFRIAPGTLIVANHQNYTDPFFITFILGPLNWFLKKPLQYPSKAAIFRNPFLRIPMTCLGAYDIGATPLESAKALLYTREALGKGHCILLFPEGQLTNDAQTEEFKMGMHMLLKGGCPVVMARLHGFERKNFWKSAWQRTFSMQLSELTDTTVEEKVDIIKEFLNGAPFDKKHPAQ